MWLVNLVTVFAAACLVSPCLSATVPEAVAETKTERVGYLNKYYIKTWRHVVVGWDMEEIANNEAAIDALQLDAVENVAIVVHGRHSSVYSEFGHVLRSFISYGTHPVILVDWSIVASLNYNQAILLAPAVANDLASFITRMDELGKLDTDLLHLIGFDLGAHIVGMASRTALNRARKITALSPAGERWDMYSQRLRVTDAMFVETINTDAFGDGAYGISDGVGGLAFFPNGGTSQPGCDADDNWCNHNRAWQLFSATVDMGGHLRGLKCDSMTHVHNDICYSVPVAVMGSLEMTKLQTGLYRLNTGSVWPYSP